MKKLFLSIVIVAVLTITACNDNGDVGASLPSGYTKVTYDEIDSYTEASVLKHSETGCYYTWVEGYKSGGVTQMFVEKNGVSVPYCD